MTAGITKTEVPVKKTIFTVCTAVFTVMVLLPVLTVTLVRSDAAMAVCFLLFFAADPLCAVLTGIAAGKNLRRLWWIPPLNAAAFLAGVWLLFEPGEPAFLRYAAVYFILGTVSMLLTAWLSTKRRP